VVRVFDPPVRPLHTPFIWCETAYKAPLLQQQEKKTTLSFWETFLFIVAHFAILLFLVSAFDAAEQPFLDNVHYDQKLRHN
jgi:hypothetical protein